MSDSQNYQGQTVKISSLVAGLLIIAFGIAGTLLSYYVIFRLNKSTEEIKEPPISNTALEQVVIEPSEPTDFERFKTLVGSGKLIEIDNMPIRSPNFSKTDTEENNRIAKEFLTSEYRRIVTPTDIRSGYLYIKAKAGNGGLTNKESIYVYLNSGANGGHLMKSKSLISDPSLKGEYLYKLDSIPLTTIPYSDDNPYQTSNWIALLNSQATNYFGGFVSTVRGGLIEKVIFAFEQ